MASSIRVSSVVYCIGQRRLLALARRSRPAAEVSSNHDRRTIGNNVNTLHPCCLDLPTDRTMQMNSGKLRLLIQSPIGDVLTRPLVRRPSLLGDGIIPRARNRVAVDGNIERGNLGFPTQLQGA